MKKPGAPVICYVTDRRGLPGNRDAAELRARIGDGLAADVDWVQIREKDLSANELCEIALAMTWMTRKMRAHVREYGLAKIIVNDRLDVALASGAGGVHLGGESLPVGAINGLRSSGVFPEAFVIGASCHSVEQAKQAERDGADYVFFGPVFETPTKARFGAPQGIELLADVSSSVRIPVIAIGGIDLTNAAACVNAGAAGIAAIRMFQEANDLKALVQELRERMKQSAAGVGN